MLIELINQKAGKLIHELEELNLIKVLKTDVMPAKNLSAKYAGKLPSEVADELQIFVTKSRNEWSNRGI